MFARIAASTRWNVVLFAAGLGVSAALSACGDPGTESDSSVGRRASVPQTVVAQYEGGYDGEKFWYRPMAIDNQGVGGSSGDGIGVTHQAVESDIPNAFFTPPPTGGAGGTASQTNTILIEQMEFHNETTWPTATCGPTPAKGACVRWRLFNSFPDSDLFRGYFYLITLTPQASCTAPCPVVVGIAPPGPGVQTSIPDPGLLGTTPASGNAGAPGLWRYGLLEHSGPEPRGQERWLSFIGSGTDPNAGKWTFHWVGQVRGALVKPTVRGNLENTTIDQAPFYTSNGVADTGMSASSSIQSTPDGRYIVFASNSTTLSSNATGNGNKVFRYDTTSGAETPVSVLTGGTSAVGGCNALQPSISADGSLVAFQSANCNLGYGTTTRSIYLRNITAGTTTLVSHGTTSLTAAPNSDSQQARISADGRFVTFISRAGNLVAGRPGGRGRIYDVYRYTVATGLIERANVPASGAWPNASQTNPDISSDGSRIVFDTQATGLVSGDTATNSDVFLYDFGGAGLSIMSVDQNAALLQSSTSSFGAISSDGTMIAFVGSTGGGNAYVTAPTATAGVAHVYLRSIASAASLSMVDTAASGTGVESNAGVASVPPSLNSDGTLVAYLSTATNLLRTVGCNTPSGACMGQPSGFPNMFVRDMVSPDPEVQRSFLVSQVRSRLTTATLPYVAAQRGVRTAGNARTMQILGARDGATAVYLSSAGNNTDWAQFNNSAGFEIYLSPFSDALFQ